MNNSVDLNCKSNFLNHLTYLYPIMSNYIILKLCSQYKPFQSPTPPLCLIHITNWYYPKQRTSFNTSWRMNRRAYYALTPVLKGNNALIAEDDNIKLSKYEPTFTHTHTIPKHNHTSDILVNKKWVITMVTKYYHNFWISLNIGAYRLVQLT